MMRMIEDIDAVKRLTAGKPKYRLANANVHVSPGGFHYIDYLDPVEKIDPEIRGDDLTDDERAYIERQLQSNAERFEHQVGVVQRFIDAKGIRLLDVGCGGGLFLAKMKVLGAEVIGIELSDSRASYAQDRHGLQIVKRPVEASYWDAYAGTYDVVTLWDVIEHVNEPAATLRAAARLLKPGGFLMIDTPCRDAFYHRAGEWTYSLSGGRYPTFLNAMYSAHLFGHKQIFSTDEMCALYEGIGLSVLDLSKFHELSFPKRVYLSKLLRSEALVRVSEPIVTLALAIIPIRNKMLAVGRKDEAGAGPDRRH